MTKIATTTLSFKTELEELLNNADQSIINEFFNSEFLDEPNKWVLDEPNKWVLDEPNKWDSVEVNNFHVLLENSGITTTHEYNEGGEGQGEEYWSVYKFTKGTEELLVKFDGSYQSYNGCEFDSWFFVTPKLVQVTQYFKQK
jgi:hypothetical protein